MGSGAVALKGALRPAELTRVNARSADIGQRNEASGETAPASSGCTRAQRLGARAFVSAAPAARRSAPSRLGDDCSVSHVRVRVV